MPPRLPTPRDFPSHLQVSIVPPPKTHPPTNVLLLLHGLGDTAEGFVTFSRNLSLPETTCISLQAPTPLPFDLGGFHWGDDVLFDDATGQMEYDTGFTRTSKIVEEILNEILIKKCGYPSRNLILFGFGQGGMAALAAVADCERRNLEPGGVISIGGPLPASPATLVLGGSSNTLVTSTTLAKIKECFDSVEYVKWTKSGDSMPRSREEMLPIMRFFARRLLSVRGVPPGSIPLS
ncbi:MAG: hypothetical protein M1833_001793 [Piccolia ochrophora]|nr:MAG: hypothetical protein M1833_001793 [Piccolia ochrophora]